MNKINLSEKFSLFNGLWEPKIVGELNNQYVKLAKLKGEFYIIPGGVEHMPVAENEAHVLMFEPKETVNTGNVESDRTVKNIEVI